MAIPENRKIPASTQIKGIEDIIIANVPLADNLFFEVVDDKIIPIGLILKSPNNTSYQITVDNDGVITAVAL